VSLAIADLNTPARLFSVVETPTEYGGFVRSKLLQGVVWGAFQPGLPQEVRSGEGDRPVAQSGLFVCNAGNGMAGGHVLEIAGADWRIISVEALPDGTVRARIERGLS
jgi:hypothetical protein